MDSKPFQEIFINQNCNHSFCDECIAKYVAAKIQENISNVKCPEPKCRGILEPQNCMSIIPKEVFERWENALCENLVLATSKKFYCPFKDCSAMLVNDDGNEVVTCSECSHCHRLFCAQCKVAWHGGMECGEFMGLNENEREKEDLMVMNLAKAKRWRRCGHRFCLWKAMESVPWLSRMVLSIDGNNHNTNNEDPKVEMMKPQKNGVELPFCGRCCDFKPSWEMFKTLKCGHNFCRFCMHEYVASCLRDNIIMVPCPDPKCKYSRDGKKVIKDCNTPILDKQLDKNPIHVADDEENNDVKEDATILSPSLVSGLPHCLRTGTQAHRCSLGSGLSHGLWSPTQSRSLAFPAFVVTDGRSSRSRDWSSSSLPVSSPSRSQSHAFVALVVAGGRSSRSRGFLLAVSNSRRQLPSQPEAGPDLYTIAIMGYGPEDENAVLEKCPEPKCKGILEPQNCVSIIPKEVFERWENALCENLVLATSKKFYCPFKNCSAMLVNDDGNEVVTCPECPHCHRLFCAQCKVAWHGGIKYGEFMSLNENEREKEDLMVMNLAKDKRWRRCGHQFCYACGKPWNQYHGCT
ncbi:hypothetical protein Ahy_B02g057854 isoform B [Arachis hypogaea]|uniref:RBR-type E3 ubiquitin transferase n=1 Tax=Arachis hypogaea TaxID=3818 RepID=A0A445AD28_ARAHY|nr:hypothetical protein Ahy_B02g057854 isoform B [Arachis hypogaea]